MNDDQYLLFKLTYLDIEVQFPHNYYLNILHDCLEKQVLTPGALFGLRIINFIPCIGTPSV